MKLSSTNVFLHTIIDTLPTLTPISPPVRPKQCVNCGISKAKMGLFTMPPCLILQRHLPENRLAKASSRLQARRLKPGRIFIYARGTHPTYSMC
jgi:hypothetical protein